jgi:hypothetical protein
MKLLRNLLMLLLCTFSATACARPLVDLSVIDRDTGEQLAKYGHHGRQYIAGAPGHRYALHLVNRTGERVMVVLSVDGVNAITGQTAGADQGGYVLGPWQSAEIAGWRKSDNDIAQFLFTELDDSYAARTGRPENVGVIGMAVFRERVPVPVYQPPVYQPPIYQQPYPSSDEMEREEAQAGGNDKYASRKDARAAGSPMAKASNAERALASGSMDSAAAAPYEPAVQRLGTGHGDREYSPIEHTEFERLTSYPQQVVTLYYDAPAQLAARGIIPRYWARPVRHAGPDPFPVGYVPDPPPSW